MQPKTLTTCGAGLATLLCLALLPALAVHHTAGHYAPCAAGDADIGAIAATIRHLESGGDYTAQAAGSSASGAYQFTDATWASYGGYERAHLASPGTQDAKAHEHINGILTRHDNDVSAVPVVWYIGHLPEPGSPTWDRVPAPGAGNRLTPRQYQQKWLRHYETHAATPDATVGTVDVVAGESCGANSHGEVLPGGWALPGPRALLEATADQIDKPHHDYPAWDWTIPTGTPIYAIRGGTVTSISTTAHNCHGWERCQRCGLGATITDNDGAQWTYCHGSALHVRPGQQVQAGEQILTSGNSGNSTGPHLHLSIRVDGTLRCPQSLVSELAERQEGRPVRGLPSKGCTRPQTLAAGM